MLSARREAIEKWSSVITKSRCKDMQELREVVKQVDTFLAQLSDERAVLKNFDWPDNKCGPAPYTCSHLIGFGGSMRLLTYRLFSTGVGQLTNRLLSMAVWLRAVCLHVQAVYQLH